MATVTSTLSKNDVSSSSAPGPVATLTMRVDRAHRVVLVLRQSRCGG